LIYPPDLRTAATLPCETSIVILSLVQCARTPCKSDDRSPSAWNS